MPFLIKFDIDDFVKVRNALEKMKREIPKRARQILRKAGKYYIEELDKATSRFSRSAGKWENTSGFKLSGSFMLRSVSLDVLQITSQVPYARVQDMGRSKSYISKPMLVPIQGISRAEISALGEEPGRIFWKKTKKNKILLVERIDKKQLRPLAKYTTSIKIPAKHYVEKAQVRVTPRILELFKEGYKDL